MSAEASAYYQGRAEAIGVDLAPCLDGTPVQLLENGRLSLHMPNEGTIHSIAMRCGEILGAAGALVTVEARRRPGEEALPFVSMPSERFVREMLLTGLHPVGLRTGHFKDISIEAITRDQIPGDVFASFTPVARARAEGMLRDESAESRQAYFLAKGLVRAGSRSLLTGAFMLVAAEAGSPVPQYLTAGLGRNALLGSSLLRDSSATSYAVDAGRMSHPAITAVGTRR